MNRRTLLRFAIAASLVVIGGFALWRWLDNPLKVELGSVSAGPLEASIEEDGKTRLKDRYVISSPLLGNVVRIELDAGDEVKAGQSVLASLQPTPPSLLDAREKATAEARKKAAESALSQSQSNKERAKEAFELAETTFARMKQLIESRSVSKQEFDIAETEYMSQKASYSIAMLGGNIAQFELEQAKAVLAHYQDEGDASPIPEFLIRSPISGRVLRVFQESSAVVQPGTPLLEVGDPLGIEIEADVLSKQAVKLREGNEVVIEHWGGDKPLHGRVRRIEPSAFTKVSALGVEEQRVNVLIDILEPAEERATLGDAFSVDTRIIYWKNERVLRVPTSALFRHENVWAVYLVEQGKARLQTVEVGHQSKDFAEVLSGLAEGSVVILFPNDQVRDGTAVMAP